MRAVRGGVFAVTSTALTYAAHVGGGGELPDAGSALLLTALIAAAGTALADRQRSVALIVTTLGVVQVALHLMLTGLSSFGHHQASMWPGWTMIAGHVGAAVLIGLLLAHADAMIFAVARVLASLLPRRSAPFPALRPLWVAVTPVVTSVHTAVLQRERGRRGPPTRF